MTPELPPPTWRAILTLLGRVPQGSFSRALGRAADTPIPRALRRPVLGAFARAAGIDVAEAELPLEEYPTLNRFFVRRLRAGARRWPGDDRVLASPVDGVVGQIGRIQGGRLIQAKGRWYTAERLLDDDAEAARYRDGYFLTIYLSPRHYHRIHAPCAGTVPMARHVPGALLPVNAPAVMHLDELFARNERLVCYLEGPLGRVAIVAVGAYNVGRISAAFDPAWGEAARGGSVTNRPGVLRPETRRYDPPPRVAQGEEIMAFHLGSTVVLLVEPGRTTVVETVAPGREVRLGSALARATREP